jgi:predicted RNA-binding Zn ribbon-like protein
MSHVSETAPTREGPFELSGGALCLDFANTARYHPPEREDLGSHGALVAWAEQAGVLGKAAARAVRAEAARRPAAAAKALARAQALRGAIYRVLSAHAAGERVQPNDLAVIAGASAEAAGHMRLVPREGGFTWETDPAALRSLDGALWPVARSASDLLTGGELATVRECALETCAWLFLDRSKNQKRRWCDMKVCGNRSKARRHYARTHGGGKADV